MLHFSCSYLHSLHWLKETKVWWFIYYFSCINKLNLTSKPTEMSRTIQSQAFPLKINWEFISLVAVQLWTHMYLLHRCTFCCFGFLFGATASSAPCVTPLFVHVFLSLQALSAGIQNRSPKPGPAAQDLELGYFLETGLQRAHVIHFKNG